MCSPQDYLFVTHVSADFRGDPTPQRTCPRGLFAHQTCRQSPCCDLQNQTAKKSQSIPPSLRLNNHDISSVPEVPKLRFIRWPASWSNTAGCCDVQNPRANKAQSILSSHSLTTVTFTVSQNCHSLRLLPRGLPDGQCPRNATVKVLHTASRMGYCYYTLFHSVNKTSDSVSRSVIYQQVLDRISSAKSTGQDRINTNGV